MTTHARVYRLLTGLYPRSFRREYGSDLVQAFTDLARERGVTAAWTRSCIDLAVTVPRYHMEALVHGYVSSSALTALALTLGFAGFAGFALGAVVGLPLLALAALLAASQRTALARSLVVPPGQRRTLLRVSAVLAVIWVAAIASWVYHVNRYDELGNTSLFLHNVVGILSLLGAIGFGLAGLLGRRRTSTA